MNTFLPYPSFTDSAKALDDKRLKNQCNEALIILRTLRGEYGPRGGWPHHPATKMWRGYESSLSLYHDAVLEEIKFRGLSYTGNHLVDEQPVKTPPWLGRADLHASHRSCLLTKDLVWYGQFGWKEPPAVRDTRGKWPYVWPTMSTP